MRLEFKRYGLEKFRIANGYLQILGGTSLLAGIYYLPLALISSFCLFLLMMCGFIVRIKIKDGLIKSFPALFYMLLNLGIFIKLWEFYNV